MKVGFKFFLSFVLVSLGLIFVLTPTAKAQEIYKCDLAQQSSFTLSMSPQSFEQGETVIFDISANPDAFDCSGGSIYLCIDRLETTTDVFCSDRRKIELDNNCSANFEVNNLNYNSELNTHTAELVDGVLVGATNICSNAVGFEVTNLEPPAEECQGLGDDCCVNLDGTCMFPGESCCNICSEPAGLYCDPLTLTVNNYFECGYAGQICCPDEPHCATGGLMPSNPNDLNNCTCITEPPPKVAELKCTKDGVEGINTAIGCIPIENRTDMMAFFIAWSIGVSGGTGLLLIVYSAFLFLISNGNPQRVQAAKEALLSALSGLVLLILAVYLLKVIGIDILEIGQLGR